MSLFIYPYKTGSKSVKALSEELDAKRIRRTGSRFEGDKEKTVINWGCSSLPDEVTACRVINSPESVAIAANKLSFLNKVGEFNDDVGYYDERVCVPDHTTSKEVAQRWLDRGYTVVERHKLTGHSGEGIKIKQDGDVLEDCPLYVMYVKKKSEWRIHVLNGVVVDVQRKARDRDVPNEQVNWLVRNHANGFIYARNEGVEPPHQVLEQAVLAAKAIGLDFGAVDIIFNEHNNVAIVLEINTAPGLTGSTLTGYAERFKELLGVGNE
jgi:glutathione synthase/RimK-type ligase-like ATP-grasp enzyme